MKPPLDALACPDDGADLFWESDRSLRCSHCAGCFPVTGDVSLLLPRTVPGASADLVNRERRQRDVEASTYDRLPGLRIISPWEIPATLGPLGLDRDSRVFEIGCGTGRLTLPILRTGARVLAVDHSIESLRVLQSKLAPPERARVTLAQGEAFSPPVRLGWATHAVAAQMLEHVPDPLLRSRVIAGMAAALSDGGRAVVSAYRRLPWLPGEGMHSGQMYFRRFSRAEFRALLEPHFRMDRLSGGLLYAWLAHGTRR